MSDQSPRNAAIRHDDIFQTLEKCVRGTPAESYFARKDYNQQAVEKHPDHTSDVSGIEDDQQSQTRASEGLLQNKNESDILPSSANADMVNYKEWGNRTHADQPKIGSETERWAKQERFRKIKIEPPLAFKEQEEPKIDPEEVAKALGAEAIEGIYPGSRGLPVSEYTLRQERSRPGKPSRK